MTSTRYAAVHWQGQRWAVWDTVTDDIVMRDGRPAIYEGTRGWGKRYAWRIANHMNQHEYQPNEETTAAPTSPFTCCPTCGTYPGGQPRLVYSRLGDNHPCPDCRGTGVVPAMGRMPYEVTEPQPRLVVLDNQADWQRELALVVDEVNAERAEYTAGTRR